MDYPGRTGGLQSSLRRHIGQVVSYGKDQTALFRLSRRNADVVWRVASVLGFMTSFDRREQPTLTTHAIPLLRTC